MPTEIAALAQLGCTYLQLDDTSLAYLNDPAQRRTSKNSAAMQSASIYLHQADKFGARETPSGMTVCTHMCRGNFRSSWVATGG